MTEASEIEDWNPTLEEMVASLESCASNDWAGSRLSQSVTALIADWRAKKAEIGRLTSALRAKNAEQSQTAQLP